MLKIPTFIIGGLLILTGLAAYLLQDMGLSLKLTGPLSDDAKFTLSDGNESLVVDLGFPSSDSAGEYAFWMVHRLNLEHAKDRSQANYAVEQGSKAYKTKSFWHASSKGDTQKALVKHAKTGELDNLAGTDFNRSKIRFVYKNFTDNTSPVTLSSTNWTNVDSKIELKSGDSLEFYKSWTAFIPGIIGIILIALVQGAEKKPNARKHIMHVAVLIGLIGFIMLAFRMLPAAVAEMNWLKGETYGIIQASSLKAITMLASAGLLLVFVIICVVSFVTARKEMAAQKKLEVEKKKKVLDKVKTKNEEADDKKSDTGYEDEKKEKSSGDKIKEDEKKYDDDAKDSDSKDSKNKKDSSKDSDKKEEKEKDSEDNDESEDSKKAVDNSKGSETPKPEPEKEAAKAAEDAPETKKEDEESTVEKKSPEAPKDNSGVEEKKPEEPSKEANSTNESDSASDSDFKDQEDSNEEKEKNPKPNTEVKEEEESEPKTDSEKSDKEENKE